MKKIVLLFTLLLGAISCINDIEAPQENVELENSVRPHFYGYARPYGNQPQTRGVANMEKLWSKVMAEEYLTVKFLNGSDSYKNFVKETAKEWEAYGGFRFEFIDDDSEESANIRVGFDYVAGMYSSWALTGTDHLLNDNQNEPTVHFAQWRRASDEIKRSDVLRAFGQVLGLELEYRHPMFYPAWFNTGVDNNGDGMLDIDEDAIKDYWEGELSDFISWDELKTMVLDPIDEDKVVSTEYYDQSSIMSWPFYTAIAYNLPAIDFDDEPITELSQKDKEFVRSLYGSPVGAMYPEPRYYRLIEFDYTGTEIEMVLTAKKTIAVLWDDGNNVTYLETTDGLSKTDTLTYTYSTSGTRRIKIAEFLDRGESNPSYSDALLKFDLKTGNKAKNFDIKQNNHSLSYIRIIGGPDFATQSFNFVGFEKLSELYLVMAKNASVTIDNCQQLTKFGTSRHIWKPIDNFGFVGETQDNDDTISPRIVVGPGDGGGNNDYDWPEIPEAEVSISSLNILNCPSLASISFENIGLMQYNFSNLTGLSYVYISSNSVYMVGASSNIALLRSKGEWLADAINTLPSRLNKTNGKVVIRSINTLTDSYNKVQIGEAYYDEIENFGNTKNWDIVWDSDTTIIN